MTRDEQKQLIDDALKHLRSARICVAAFDCALTDSDGPTALGHVVSALSKLERRRALLQ